MSNSSTSQNNVIGICDIANTGKDTLDIGRHAAALTKFIRYTATPMTVGVQGEWGSGKTSLLNQIYTSLEKEGAYKQIWINSWEHSLLAQPEEALLKIINEIIQEMLGSDKNITNKDQVTKVASNIFKGALRVGASIVGGTDASKVTNELLGGEKEGSIRELRAQLNNLAAEIEGLNSNPYEKIIIYVDDLDRIEPKNAVQILELLKNVFNIDKCVFILAIDYQVVVKGLKEKFGEQTEENEWEFRAFFDKIIQLPFMMPMGQYNIGKYVGDLLEKTGFIQDSEQSQDRINKLVSLSIGGNPRSLKRLVNSLTLIDIFSGVNDDLSIDSVQGEEIDENIKLLLLAIICLQISYPIFYDLLSKNPNFSAWNRDVAFKQTKLSEEKDKDKFDKDFSIVKNTETFDEEWEEVIYRICYSKPRYYSRVDEISKFFNFIKSELLKDKSGDIENIIIEVIEKTAVTNVSSTDDTQAQLPKGQKYKAPEGKTVSDLVFEAVTDLFNNGVEMLAAPMLKAELDKRHPGVNIATIRAKMAVYSSDSTAPKAKKSYKRDKKHRDNDGNELPGFDWFEYNSETKKYRFNG